MLLRCYLRLNIADLRHDEVLFLTVSLSSFCLVPLRIHGNGKGWLVGAFIIVIAVPFCNRRSLLTHHLTTLSTGGMGQHRELLHGIYIS
jgi:hypothetical protein